jgi:hypothetical protein
MVGRILKALALSAVLGFIFGIALVQLIAVHNALIGNGASYNVGVDVYLKSGLGMAMVFMGVIPLVAYIVRIWIRYLDGYED